MVVITTVASVVSVMLGNCRAIVTECLLLLDLLSIEPHVDLTTV